MSKQTILTDDGYDFETGNEESQDELYKKFTGKKSKYDKIDLEDEYRKRKHKKKGKKLLDLDDDTEIFLGDDEPLVSHSPTAESPDGYLPPPIPAAAPPTPIVYASPPPPIIAEPPPPIVTALPLAATTATPHDAAAVRDEEEEIRSLALAIAEDFARTGGIIQVGDALYRYSGIFYQFLRDDEIRRLLLKLYRRQVAPKNTMAIINNASVSGKTQKEVAQKLRQLTAEIDQGTYQEPTKITVGGWLDTWVELYLGDVKPRTADLYRRTIEVYLKPAFGGLKLENLKSIDVQRLYSELQNQEKPLSPKTIRNIHGVLHKALQQAVELGYIRTNPSDPCKLPKVEKAAIKPLDNEAMKAFLEVIRGHRYENIYLVTLFTGMREGEVLGLKWDSIDFQNGTILISQQLQRNVDGTGGFTFVSPN